MCEINFSIPVYDPMAPSFMQQTSVWLTICQYTDIKDRSLSGARIEHDCRFLNANNYLSMSYVQLPNFIKYSKEIGIEINDFFISVIIENDDAFRELKRSSKQLPNGKLNIKEAGSKYMKHFNGFSTDTILKACEHASARYDIEESAKDKDSKKKDHRNITYPPELQLAIDAYHHFWLNTEIPPKNNQMVLNWLADEAISRGVTYEDKGNNKSGISNTGAKTIAKIIKPN